MLRFAIDQPLIAKTAMTVLFDLRVAIDFYQKHCGNAMLRTGENAVWKAPCWPRGDRNCTDKAKARQPATRKVMNMFAEWNVVLVAATEVKQALGTADCTVLLVLEYLHKSAGSSNFINKCSTPKES